VFAIIIQTIDNEVLILFFLIISMPTIAIAQGIPQGVGGNSNNNNTPQSNPTDSEVEEEKPDTATIYYHFSRQFNDFQAVKDTSLSNNFHQYDPARRRRFDAFHLGNVGTAMLPVVYQPRNRFGTDLGQHVFDAYHLDNQDIPFYKLKNALTDVQYDFTSQANSNLKAQFSRNFAGGLNMSVQYQRTMNLNDVFKNIDTAYYLSPRARTSAFGIGFWYHDKGEKYDGFFTFTSNIVIQRNTGGMISDTNLTKLVRNTKPPTVPLFLSDTTYHTSRAYAYRHFYKLNKKDSTGAKRQFLLSHQIQYVQQSYKFDDFNTNTVFDSAYFKTFLTDTRGLRYFLSNNLIENSFSISTTQARKSVLDTLKKQADNAISIQKDWFEVGLVHQYRQINEEPLNYSNQNVLITGRWHFSPNDQLRLESYAHFNALGANLGDYRVSGNLYLNLKNIGSLQATFLNQLSEPSLLEKRLFVSQRKLWDNNFSKTLETNLVGTIQIPKLRFEGTVGYTLLNNYVYFDSLAFARQLTSPMSILQLIVKQDFTFRKVHFDSELAFQKATDKVLRLPTLYGKHSLYFEGKLFKQVMLLRTGVDVRYANTYQGYGYMPLTGQFFLQNGADKSFFPFMDAFLSAKVERFRIFIKYENISKLLNINKNIGFGTAFYPMTAPNFRVGIRWELRN
jgi:Putative porin